MSDQPKPKEQPAPRSEQELARMQMEKMPRIAVTDNTKVNLNALERIKDLEEKLRVAEGALDEIANADYRGNRSPESGVAYRALAKIRGEK